MIMREIHSIIIHCSDSEWGDAKVIDQWHRARGFASIGYHYVILNGFRTHARVVNKQAIQGEIGLVEIGRPLERIGAHCKGHNAGSIGICLIGRSTFPAAQMAALKTLVATLQHRARQWPHTPIPGAALPDTDSPLTILGHRELDPGKTCPNLDPDWLRTFLR